jgi:hypothetical protein
MRSEVDQVQAFKSVEGVILTPSAAYVQFTDATFTLHPHASAVQKVWHNCVRSYAAHVDSKAAASKKERQSLN